MRVALFGAEGKVGAALEPVLERAGHEVKAIEIGDAADVRGLDACVDFTTPEAAPENVRAALEQGVSCVVGTTGWDPQPLHALAEERGLRLFVAPNFSIGAVLMMRFAAEPPSSRGPRSSSCTTRRRRTRLRAPRRRRPN
jgi:4-hydroxy-tetrahydrodipicolinate reductase